MSMSEAKNAHKRLALICGINSSVHVSLVTIYGPLWSGRDVTESLHTIHHTMMRNGYMMVKINYKKAHETLRWDLIEEMHIDLKPSAFLIIGVMQYIYIYNVNASALGEKNIRGVPTNERYSLKLPDVAIHLYFLHRMIGAVHSFKGDPKGFGNLFNFGKGMPKCLTCSPVMTSYSSLKLPSSKPQTVEKFNRALELKVSLSKMKVHDSQSVVIAT